MSKKTSKGRTEFTFVDVKLTSDEIQEAIALSSGVESIMTALEEYIEDGWSLSFKKAKNPGSVAAYLTCMNPDNLDYLCSIGCFSPHIRDSYAVLWVKLDKANAKGGLLGYHHAASTEEEQLYG